VTCPVALHNAIAPSGDIRFNLINPDTGNRIKMITIDAGTEDPVDRRSLVKGFEVAKGEYVTITPDEIEAVKLESTKTIEIESFVAAEDIDRLYWDHPYFLVPDGKMAAEPYAVIRTAMEQAGQVALGRVVINQRERLLALEPRDKGMIATTLRSHDEVRSAKEAFTDIPDVKIDKNMIDIAGKIIQQKETEFDPELFVDRYEDALRDLIKEKQKGHEIVQPEEPRDTTNVVDLMEALRASLKGGKTTAPPTGGRRKPGGRAPARKAAAKKPTKKRA
jgi:DNA end-binding protein Ku